MFLCTNRTYVITYDNPYEIIEVNSEDKKENVILWFEIKVDGSLYVYNAKEEIILVLSPVVHKICIEDITTKVLEK